jgi:hypothetical protein
VRVVRETSGTLREDVRKAVVVCLSTGERTPQNCYTASISYLFTVKAGGRYSNHSSLHAPPRRERVPYIAVDVAPTLHCVHPTFSNALGASANDNLITVMLKIMQP